MIKVKEIEKISIQAHLEEQHIKTEDGLPLDWKHHRFMKAVYKDMASLERDICGFKAAQVTFTTTAINSILWLAKNRKIDIIYCLPTFDDIRQFSGSKMNRIIAQNPIYGDWVTEKDTIEQKIVGDNIINLRGTYTAKSATMISSSLNVMDEFDSMNQQVAEQYSTRLQHSQLKRQWWFSHPSVPGNGVDRKWVLSDQKHWHIKCGACKKWHYMEWPKSFDLEKRMYICKLCGAEVTDKMRREGQWFRKYKDREISGYWIPLFLMGKVTAGEVIDYHETKPADYFYNKVLGLPYLGGGNKVLQQEIEQNYTSVPHKMARRLVMGVDTGETIRWVIGNKKQGLARYGEDKDYSSVERFLQDTKDGIVIMDEGGDITEPRRLRAKYRGRLFLCHYQRDRKTLQLVRWGDNDEYGHVLVDRDRMIQTVVDKFREKKIPIHYKESKDEWYDFWLHWSHIYRTTEEDKATHDMIHKWQRSDRDDWVHATCYWYTGVERFGGIGSVESRLTMLEPDSYYVTKEGKTSIMPTPLKKFVEMKGWVDEEKEDWRE